MEFDFASQEVVRIGVLADTHVPDRVGDLHPEIIPIFQQHKVDLIIHAGDISIPAVLEKLEDVAPVEAVQGNRDWWRMKALPASKIITIKEVTLLITHGHGHFFSYLWDKVPYWLLGYRFERFVRKFSRLQQDFDIVIYGHSHRPENRWVDGRLYFNPGSAYDPLRNHSGPTIGVIEIGGGKRVEARIMKMREMRWWGDKWADT